MRLVWSDGHVSAGGGGVLVASHRERSAGQRPTSAGREQRFVRLAVAFTQPWVEDRDGFSREHRAVFLAALAE
jgi:hypothetical protein